jgi:2-oxoglutarate ferredoxin oxidoreductase subunit gamma
MESEVVFSGIGGQGIQLIGKCLALAAIRQGRYAMLAADYGGEMRGGPSQVSVVLGDEPLRALPILPSFGAAVLMHHKFADFVHQRLRPDGLLVVNTSIVPLESLSHPGPKVGLAVTEIARELGAPQAAGFVIVGAYCELTGVVETAAVDAAMRSLLPPYRAHHADANARAIEAGRAAAEQAASMGAPVTVGGTA